MNFVEPIRDRKKIAQIKNLLRGQQRYRDLLAIRGWDQLGTAHLGLADFAHQSLH